ncbi:unnamed protein product, partial [Amoebophrya sp. A120]|eukprot:GSA120T00023815001.1
MDRYSNNGSATSRAGRAYAPRDIHLREDYQQNMMNTSDATTSSNPARTGGGPQHRDDFGSSDQNYNTARRGNGGAGPPASSSSSRGGRNTNGNNMNPQTRSSTSFFSREQPRAFDPPLRLGPEYDPPVLPGPDNYTSSSHRRALLTGQHRDPDLSHGFAGVETFSHRRSPRRDLDLYEELAHRQFRGGTM